MAQLLIMSALFRGGTGADGPRHLGLGKAFVEWAWMSNKRVESFKNTSANLANVPQGKAVGWTDICLRQVSLMRKYMS